MGKEVKMETMFYTTDEVAEKLKVNVMTIYRYIKAGKLTAHKIGKEYRIKSEDFDSFVNACATK